MAVLFSITDQFSTVQAFNNLDIFASQTPISTVQVQDAIKDTYGIVPLLMCSQDILTEVRLCFDKTLKVMTCPSKYASFLHFFLVVVPHY